MLDANKMIVAQPTGVTIGSHSSYGDVPMAAFLAELAGKVKRNGASLDAFNRIREDDRPARRGRRQSDHDPPDVSIASPKMLNADSAVIAETGNSWFNGMHLKLPEGARFEIQMQYGSIGWSVGATLGYALGSSRRVVTLVGDGSFQMTAQEVSTMIRYGLKPIIFLINNGGYTIEVEIHDGPYNPIKNWDYAGLDRTCSMPARARAGARASPARTGSTQRSRRRSANDGLEPHRGRPSAVTIAARNCSSGAATSPPTTRRPPRIA